MLPDYWFNDNVQFGKAIISKGEVLPMILVITHGELKEIGIIIT
jgi:hypothetical protein